eukprot:Nk52_evm11s289 gene=Nk52_evmTU11s289
MATQSRVRWGILLPVLLTGLFLLNQSLLPSSVHAAPSNAMPNEELDNLAAEAGDDDAPWEVCHNYEPQNTDEMQFRKSPQVHRGVILSNTAYLNMDAVSNNLWFFEYMPPAHGDPGEAAEKEQRPSVVKECIMRNEFGNANANHNQAMVLTCVPFEEGYNDPPSLPQPELKLDHPPLELEPVTHVNKSEPLTIAQLTENTENTIEINAEPIRATGRTTSVVYDSGEGPNAWVPKLYGGDQVFAFAGSNDCADFLMTDLGTTIAKQETMDSDVFYHPDNSEVKVPRTLYTAFEDSYSVIAKNFTGDTVKDRIDGDGRKIYASSFGVNFGFGFQSMIKSSDKDFKSIQNIPFTKMWDVPLSDEVLPSWESIPGDPSQGPIPKEVHKEHLLDIGYVPHGIDLVGHSLGGTQAQMFASRILKLIVDIHNAMSNWMQAHCVNEQGMDPCLSIYRDAHKNEPGLVLPRLPRVIRLITVGSPPSGNKGFADAFEKYHNMSVESSKYEICDVKKKFEHLKEARQSLHILTSTMMAEHSPMIKHCDQSSPVSANKKTDYCEAAQRNLTIGSSHASQDDLDMYLQCCPLVQPLGKIEKHIAQNLPRFSLLIKNLNNYNKQTVVDLIDKVQKSMKDLQDCYYLETDQAYGIPLPKLEIHRFIGKDKQEDTTRAAPTDFVGSGHVPHEEMEGTIFSRIWNFILNFFFEYGMGISKNDQGDSFFEKFDLFPVGNYEENEGEMSGFHHCFYTNTSHSRDAHKKEEDHAGSLSITELHASKKYAFNVANFVRAKDATYDFNDFQGIIARGCLVPKESFVRKKSLSLYENYRERLQQFNVHTGESFLDSFVECSYGLKMHKAPRPDKKVPENAGFETLLEKTKSQFGSSAFSKSLDQTIKWSYTVTKNFKHKAKETDGLTMRKFLSEPINQPPAYFSPFWETKELLNDAKMPTLQMIEKDYQPAMSEARYRIDAAVEVLNSTHGVSSQDHNEVLTLKKIAFCIQEALLYVHYKVVNRTYLEGVLSEKDKNQFEADDKNGNHLSYCKELVGSSINRRNEDTPDTATCSDDGTFCKMVKLYTETDKLEIPKIPEDLTGSHSTDFISETRQKKEQRVLADAFQNADSDIYRTMTELALEGLIPLKENIDSVEAATDSIETNLDSEAASTIVRNCAITSLIASDPNDESSDVNDCKTKELMHCDSIIEKCKSKCTKGWWYSWIYNQCDKEHSECESERSECEESSDIFSSCFLEKCMVNPYRYSHFLWYPGVEYDFSAKFSEDALSCSTILG